MGRGQKKREGGGEKERKKNFKILFWRCLKVYELVLPFRNLHSVDIKQPKESLKMCGRSILFGRLFFSREVNSNRKLQRTSHNF